MASLTPALAVSSYGGFLPDLTTFPRLQNGGTDRERVAFDGRRDQMRLSQGVNQFDRFPGRLVRVYQESWIGRCLTGKDGGITILVNETNCRQAGVGSGSTVESCRWHW